MFSRVFYVLCALNQGLLLPVSHCAHHPPPQGGPLPSNLHRPSANQGQCCFCCGTSILLAPGKDREFGHRLTLAEIAHWADV